METIDAKIKELFEKVQTQKEAIAKAEKPNWETNCTFDKNGDGNRINIQVVREPIELVKILAFLHKEEEIFSLAAKELGIDIVYKHQGYTLNQWKTDLQARINKLNIEQEKNKLAMLETRLNGIISPEQKRQMELDEITKML